MASNITILQPRILNCMSLCLEEMESCNTFPDTGGIPVIIGLASSDDLKLKKLSGVVVSKLARIGKLHIPIKKRSKYELLKGIWGSPSVFGKLNS